MRLDILYMKRILLKLRKKIPSKWNNYECSLFTILLKSQLLCLQKNVLQFSESENTFVYRFQKSHNYVLHIVLGFHPWREILHIVMFIYYSVNELISNV